MSRPASLERSRQLLFPKMGTIVVVADSTLVRLSSIAEWRWGLVTTTQAENVGVSRKQLARMASAGALERVAQGVYRMAGAPRQDHEAIYATWLALGGATAPRTETGVAPVVAAGVTAAVVHGIGDFLPDSLDFIVPARKGTRLPGVRLRIRRLIRDEVIPVGGLPALTVERAVADLVETGTDMSLVAGVVRDAVRAGKLVSPEHLVSYLDSVGARRDNDGRSVANELFELAGVYPEGWRRG
jgi:predicted transcriptional regulator of viral defense system